MSDLIIYDSEATDADRRHGQITQFGALRSDTDFNVLEEINFRVRRLPWVVPTPKALEVTRMRAEDLCGPGTLSEYAASGIIEKFLTPGYGVPRTFVTYNGPRFDDELIRTTLFRNLRNPWFSSGKQSTRVDMLSVVQLVNSVDPDALVVPRTEEGKLTWRLERLCPANGIEMDAHDALSDARATFELMKLVTERAPWAWELALEFGRPLKTESLLENAAVNGKPVWLFTHFGTPEVTPCIALGTDSKKKWILADLKHESFPEGGKAISDTLYGRNTPFPIIRSNAAPVILDTKTALRINPDFDPEAITVRIGEIKNSALPRDALAALNSRSFENVADPTSEETIYSGFVHDRDKPAMTAFHRATSWQARAATTFKDSRLIDFAARIVLEAHMNDEFTEQQDRLDILRERCAEALARPFARIESRWATIEKALAEGADEDWIAWARAEFGSAPAFEKVQADPAPLQMDMGF